MAKFLYLCSMKYVVPLLVTLLFTTLNTLAAPLPDSAWRYDVKSVELYVEGGPQTLRNEQATPVLTLDGGGLLVLEFDILGTEPEHLRWTIGHCSRHWLPDSLTVQDFITGFHEGYIDAYDPSFTTLTDYIHYRTTLPDRYASFTHSGNYIVAVTTDDGDTLLTRRFCVSEESASVRLDLNRPYDGIDIDRRQELDVTVASKSIALNQLYLSIEAQQNGRLDNRRWLQFSGYDGPALAYRNRQPNIFHGGNVFRYFDCSNLRTPMYNVLRVSEYGGEYLALLRPDDDRSAKHYLTETQLLGGYKVNVWDRNNPRVEADYVWVNFSLPVEQPYLDANIYVVGALTDWRLDSLSLMEYNPQRRAYTKRLQVKQGYYAYQLLSLPSYTSQLSTFNSQLSTFPSATARLEGDHRETPNRYTVYVYFRSPADRADRLLAVGRR